MAGTDDRTHFELPPVVLALLLSSAAGGGAGLYGVLGPQLEKEAITACFDNSQTALKVAAQHGAEILDLRELIYARTANRFTLDDAAKTERAQLKTDAQQDRRLLILERDIDRLLKGTDK